MELSRIFGLLACLVLTLSSTPAAPSTLVNSNTTTTTNIFTSILAPYREQIREWSTRIGKDGSEVGILADYFGCGLCTLLIGAGGQVIDKFTEAEITEMVIIACQELDLAPKPEICPDIITAYADQFLYILKHAPAGMGSICGILNTDCGATNSSLTDWPVAIDPNKPELVAKPPVSEGVPSVKILQFTDIHMDLNYLEGTTNECGAGMPICCREEFGYPGDNPSKTAGKYGDFNCALPEVALEAVFVDAKNRYPDAKYIFLTGDYIHSGVWLYNVNENTKHISGVVELLLKVFNGTGVRIYPLTGNHEAHVINMYTPVELWDKDGYDMSWLYNTVLDPILEKDPNLLTPKEIANFKKYGSYSASPEPGVRILAINTNLCYTNNFWLAYYPRDPNNQLNWLSEQLFLAEARNENVFIIGHVQPGSCWPVWSGKFDKVVSRYEGIIKGQFYGHSHTPQYRLNFDKVTWRPTSTSFIAGSVLTDSMNPGYAAYHVDGARGAENTWEVLKQDNVVLQLAESNAKGEPVVVLQADSRSTFGMADLRPETVLDFAHRMICDQKLLSDYKAYHTKGSNSPRFEDCKITDFACLSGTLCEIVGSDNSDPGPCERMKQTIRATDCSTGGHGSESGAGDSLPDTRHVSLSLLALALIPFIFKH